MTSVLTEYIILAIWEPIPILVSNDAYVDIWSFPLALQSQCSGSASQWQEIDIEILESQITLYRINRNQSINTKPCIVVGKYQDSNNSK